MNQRQHAGPTQRAAVSFSPRHTGLHLNVPQAAQKWSRFGVPQILQRRGDGGLGPTLSVSFDRFFKQAVKRLQQIGRQRF